MAQSLFDIFGDHLTRQVVKNVSRQPLANIENFGKTLSTGPVKPNEPQKNAGEPKKSAGEPKKSFLSNAGKALQSTPARKVFTPKTVNVGSLIYDENKDKGFCMEEIEFTKPTRKNDAYHCELFNYLLPEPQIAQQISPPATPPPVTQRHSMDLDCSYQDEFFTDDFSNDSLPEDDLGLPALY